MNSKKIIASILAFSLLFSTIASADITSNGGKYTKETTEVNQNNVYYVDENGNSHESDIPNEFFVELEKNGNAKYRSINEKGIKNNIETPDSEIIISSIPGEYEGTILYTPLKKSFTNADVNTAITIAIGACFGAAWTALTPSIVIAGSTTAVTQSAWKGVWKASAAGTAVAKATQWAKVQPTYSKNYQYTSWSTYYSQYLIYQVIIFYPDSTYTTPINTQYWIDTYSSMSAGSKTAN